MTGFERGHGGWFQTFSGKQVYPVDPKPSDVELIDIAHALSRICRFGGHVKCEHYSVAQHSHLVSHTCSKENALIGLMHDAAEAYIGDMVRPLKYELDRYLEIEKAWEQAIDERFSFGGKLVSLPADVKLADRILLATERRDVMGPGAWSTTIKPRVQVIDPWPPNMAYRIFMIRFEELTS